MAAVEDIRFVPLYTVAEAARYVRVPQSTYRDWAKGYDREQADRHGRLRHVHAPPVITAEPTHRRGHPVVPFIGLAESLVLAAFRKAGVSMQHIRQVIPVLEGEVGVAHALASKRLYTNGAEILYDYVQRGHIDDEAAEELAGLTRLIDRQRVFGGVVRDYLTRIEWATDGLAEELTLPYGTRPLLRVRPDRGSGKPLFVRGGAPLDQVVARWRAGDRLIELAEDYEVPVDDIEDALRLTIGMAA